MTPLLERVLVVGSSCSGKTTFAHDLAARSGAPPVDLDALHWGPDWTPVPRTDFHAAVVATAALPRWVVSGNYSEVRDLLWPRATAVVWLNYSLPVVLGRALRRTVRRVATREVLWAGNRESFRRSFASRDSILLWVISTFDRRRTQMATLRASNAFPDLHWIEFRQPRDAQRMLDGIAHQRGMTNGSVDAPVNARAP